LTQWFAGQFLQKVDGKGRVSVPAEFRRVLEKGDPEWSSDRHPQFVIVFGDEHPDTPVPLRRSFMECHSISLYQEIVSWIRDQDDVPETEARVELYSTFSQLVTVDDTGRVVIPPRLRKRFGLSNCALFVAVGTTFQIWAPGTYEAYKDARRKSWSESLPKDFNPRVPVSRLGGT